MNEKKQLVINTAMKLFAQNGYHATSMQEVADKCGIAKGSLYNYFSSKEDLLLSVYQYYYNLMRGNILKAVEESGLQPLERLRLKIEMQLKELMRYRDFIQMQMREQAFPINEEISAFLLKTRSDTLNWYAEHLIRIYGERMRSHAYDGAALLSGILKEYVGFIIFDRQTIDIHRLSSFIVNRFNDMALGLMEEPDIILGTDTVQKFLDVTPFEEQSELQQARDLAEKLTYEIKDLDLAPELKRHLLAAASRLKEGLRGKLTDKDFVEIQQHLLTVASSGIPELAACWEPIIPLLRQLQNGKRK
ncbi:TetR/AcrR family transcriptional regulator [Bacillus marinisedimentorum]|uniref:TetR/AcrR family transcriptional regulator n=1 Tax=Bacillus marinisedimentorum TaxID=1821260 RepID=UPI0007E1478D|nr:TetR/AcrR family transcriptional regulator [Bacillus marinisedimentorum]